ncbi:MAG: Two component regulator three Y domain protein [Croceitalea sp.]|nr:Two component regulator three Y domain protein [Croceitalea sp.]
MIKSKILAVFVFLLLCAGPLAAQEEVSEREIIALLELQYRTGGENWVHAWDLNSHVSTWHGVTVKNGKIVGLELPDNNLVGNIPLTLGNLKNLEVLNLSNNQLKGRIPIELRKFDHLKVMNLSNNLIKGTIPTTINRLQKLEILDLSNNNIGGDLPNSLVELTNLNSLVLANNKIIGELPNGMENLTKLTKLMLANNQFTNFTNLKKLSVQQTVLIDIDVNSRNYAPINFSDNPDGLAELKFDEEKN